MRRLYIQLLGTLQATLDGDPITFKTDKARALIAYLAVENHRPHRREHLAGLLWSDQPEKKALHSLRQTLSTLRSALNKLVPDTPYLLINRTTVQFNPDSNVRLDVSAFRSAVQKGLPQNQHSHITRRLNPICLKKALMVYQGHFLDQIMLRGSPLFDEWAILQREVLTRQVLEVMGVMTEYYEKRGEFDLACQVGERIVELVPWEENAHRIVMRMLAQGQRYSAAEMQFQTCQRYLETELGVQPTSETQTLLDEIRQYAARNVAYPSKSQIPHHNLSPSTTPFVGREAELSTLAEILTHPKNRLVTILGPGGIGKSRLSVRTANEQIGIFKDGVFFIPLTHIDTPDLLAPSIAEAISFSFYSPKDPLALLIDHLRDKEMLLVLDNLEHLLTGQALIVDNITLILENAPGIIILATSRQPLGLRMEVVFEVDGLAYPSDDLDIEANDIDPNTFSALTLFDQIARRVNPKFSLQTELAEVIRICHHLHGIPLGIELAASWSRQYSTRKIADQISQDIDFVTTPMRDVPTRHRSLRSVFEHSWQLLTDVEKEILRKLSVFHGDFSSAAALEVASASPDQLTSLVDKSLLYETHTERYELHSLLLQFAREKLEQDSLTQKITHNRHCNYYLSYMQRRGAGLYGHNPLKAQEEISQEIENIRASWIWAGNQHKISAINQAASGLGRYYDMRSLFFEGEKAFGGAVNSMMSIIDPDQQALRTLGKVTAHRDWFQVQLGNYQTAVESLDNVLQTLSSLNSPGEFSFALNVMGSAVYELGEFDRAQAYFERSLSESQETTQKSEQAFALNYLGNIARNQGEFPEAEAYFNQSLDLYEALQDQWGLARVLNNLGSMAGMSGDYAEAETIFLESLSIRRKLKDLAGVAGCLHNLSNIAYIAKDFQKTQELRQECLVICREIGFIWGVASTLKHLGDVDKALGDLSPAMQRYNESLEISRKSGDRRSEAFTLSSMGSLTLEQGDLKGARIYLVDALKTAMEIEVIPLVLDILLGIAELSTQEGDTQLALDLVTFTLEQDGTEKQTQEKGDKLKTRLLTEIPSEKTLGSQTFKKTASLQEVINHLV